MSGHLIDWIPVQAKRIVQEQQAKEAAVRREELRRAEAEAKRIEAAILNAFSKGRKTERCGTKIGAMDSFTKSSAVRFTSYDC